MIEKKVGNFKRNIRKKPETCFKVEYNFYIPKEGKEEFTYIVI